jgi:hypothetical protein
VATRKYLLVAIEAARLEQQQQGDGASDERTWLMPLSP